jgi:hypothetical protein
MAKRANTDKRSAEHRARSDERKADVAATLTKLKGSTRSDIARDDRRGAASQLGHGHVAEREERRRRR